MQSLLSHFKNLRLQTKQIIGFGIILGLLITINIYSILTIRDLRTELEIASGNSLPRAIAISDVNFFSSSLRISQLQMIFSKSEEEKQSLSDRIQKSIDDINENLDVYLKLKSESEKIGLYFEKEQDLFDDFDLLWDEYQNLSISCFRLFRDGKTEEGLALLNGDAKIVFNAYSLKLQEMVNLYDDYLVDSVKRATESFKSAREFTLTLLLIAIAISVIMTIIIVRLITVPVKRLEAAANAVSEGDLWVNVKYNSKDELGTLSKTFNSMISSLRTAQERAEEKSNKLQLQWEVLRETNDELQEKSKQLEKERKITEQKNHDLEQTLNKLKEAQNQLVQSEKMASVGQLTAGIAHEINNPINFVSSNVSPLKRDIEDIISILSKYEELSTNGQDGQFSEVEKLKRDLDYGILINEINQLLKGIEEGSRRTTSIIKGLRNFSRLDEDEQKLADIHQGLDSTLMVLRNELKNKVTVETDYTDIPPISCFPGKLNQVFLNIIQNANQAIEDNGTIKIRTWMDKSCVYISIKDDGCGMNENVKSKIFDPFYTTKDVGKGTGLGLSISFGIIKDHNGDITVKSSPGSGSEFIIKIPLKY